MKIKLIVILSLSLVLMDVGYLMFSRFFLEYFNLDFFLLGNGAYLAIAASVIIYRMSRSHVKLQKPSELIETIAQFGDQLLINLFPDLLCLKDHEGRWLKASARYLESFNLKNALYTGKTDIELTKHSGSDADALQMSAIQDKSAWHLGHPVKENRKISRPGKPDEILVVTRTPLFDSEQRKYRLVITGGTVDDFERNKSRLELVSKAFQVSHLSIALLDESFNLKEINLAFSKLTGYQQADLFNKPLASIIVIDEKTPFNPSHSVIFSDSSPTYWSGEVLCLAHAGGRFPARIDISSVISDSGNTVYFATLTDNTKQKMAEKRILQIAHYDSLTGLSNRVMFFERLGQFLSTSQRYHLHAVIFFIDLDRFKSVNDNLGHDAGDDLLKETAKRLKDITRKGDIVARLSGDEFALLLLNEKSHEQAIYSASLIANKIIEKLSETFYIQRREVFIGSSIGISIYPEDGTSPEVLIKNADIAMYEAKNKGRNNYQFFKKDFTVATQDRMVLELNLRKAIAKNELQLYYQPQYETESRKLIGAEVLIRWFHGGFEQKKMIPPNYFIPIAEETGLILDIGKWIIRTACAQIKSWLVEGFPLRQVAVNISARQFSDPNFMQIVEDALRDARLHPRHLELEITESMLIGDTKRIELQLHRLKKMGIGIALDDFGTGYSSLSYLKNFPIDILKIDQSFVRDMTVDSKDARIACAIIDMGHSLGQKIVAEGVENQEQLSYLMERGCDYIQGYFFSPPVPANKMTDILRNELNAVGAVNKAD